MPGRWLPRTLRLAPMVVAIVLASAASLSLSLGSGSQKSQSAVPPASATPNFERDVLPILKANCVQCHGPDLKLKDMNLSTLDGVMKGSESGTVVIPGKPEESRLFQMVNDGKMPKGGKALAKDQVEVIRAWIQSAVPAASETAAADRTPLTQHDVVPIMLLRCAVCHGLRRQDGGLDLHSRDAMLRGGKSGSVIIPGKPDESLILAKIRSGEMPPKRRMLEVDVKPITQSETDKLARWIAQGAPEGNVVPDVAGSGPDPLVTDKDRQFWAFRPPVRPPVPTVQHAEQVHNPLDAFLLSKLEQKGLTFSPEADRLTLIRRAAFDLTGLPPTREEVEAFLADRDPNAYEKVIDRLLASPRYGERWGRHWLDVAGYADSEGGKLSADHPRPNAWRYRDYVIRSFNADKPYDRFLIEQIAGDELADWEHAPVVTEEMMNNLIATGFLRMGPDSTSEREVNFADDRLDVIADEIDVLGGGVLGLTIKCARCHSHKYDPIPQRDYYRLVDVFKGAYDYNDWLMPQYAGDGGKVMGTRYLPYVTPGATPVELLEEQQQRELHNTELDRQIKALKAELEEKAEPVKKKILDQRLAQLPAAVQEDLRQTLSTPPEQRTEVQKYLAEKFGKVLKVEKEELKRADSSYRKAAESAERQEKLLEVQKIPEPKIRALWDRGEPSPTYILRRGDSANFAQLVGPGVPSVLTDGKTPLGAQPPWPGAHSTGRRLALARWLARPDNPLTARAMVNRVWALHFGAGIVKTLGNFGKTGAPPSHQELLDWLATEFVRQGWSVKAMHRLMMTSAAYRQSSVATPALEKADPDNRLLSRMPLKRMEAELLFDTLLFVSGRLDETPFGSSEPVLLRDDGLVTPIETEKGWRRSIYVTQRRTEMPTLLDNFDLPAMSPNCLERNISNVAPQALNLMNDTMVYKLAGFFAERVRKAAGDDPAKQVETAYWMALDRAPTEEEKRVSLEGLNGLKEVQSGKRPARHISAHDSTSAQIKTIAAVSTPVVGADRPAAQAAAAENPNPASPLAEFCHTLLNSAAFLYID